MSAGLFGKNGTILLSYFRTILGCRCMLRDSRPQHDLRRNLRHIDDFMIQNSEYLIHELKLLYFVKFVRSVHFELVN